MDGPSETPSLRERNKQEKLRRIREAARDLFLLQGYEATTTRQVAERAGVATGTLFLYARDKPELVFLIFRDEVGRVIEEAFAALPEGGLVDQATTVFAAFFSHYARRPELSRLFVKELIFLGEEKMQEHASLTLGFLMRICGLVEGAQGRGEVRGDVAPGAVANNFFALYLYHLMMWLALGAQEPEGAVRGLRQALVLQVEGLRPLEKGVDEGERAA